MNFFKQGFETYLMKQNLWLRKKKKNVSSSLHFTHNIRGILHFIIISLGNVTFYVTSAVHDLHIPSFDLQLLTNLRDCCVIKTRKHKYVRNLSQTCLKLKITVLLVTCNNINLCFYIPVKAGTLTFNHWKHFLCSENAIKRF